MQNRSLARVLQSQLLAPKARASSMALVAALGVASLAACSSGGDTGSQSPESAVGSSDNAPATSGGSNGSNGGSSNGSGPASTGGGGGGSQPTPAPVQTNPLAGLDTGAKQLATLCARGGSDTFTKAMCNGAQVTSLADLQKILGLSFADPSAKGFNGVKGNPAFALLGHSTSVLARDVSAANPRAILFTSPSSWQIDKSIALDPASNQAPPAGWNPPATPDQMSWQKPGNYTPPTQTKTLSSWPPVVTIPGQCTAWGGCGPSTTANGFNGQGTGSANGSFAVLSYTRGEPFAEITAHDPKTNELRFFLVKFDPQCRGSACDSGDTFGPSVESSWKNVSVYEDLDLANTVLDCSHCHTDGSGKKTLRMQEMASPWTHWMSPWTAGGAALLSDFHAVHGDKESYGGIPAALIDKSEPRTLELLVTDNGYAKNASSFASQKIETEVKAVSPSQPELNLTPGTSATWSLLFTSQLAQGTFAAPYHDVKVADANKLGDVASRYQSFLTTGDASWIPSMRDMHGAASVVDLGYTPPAAASASDILGQTCSGCHNATTPSALGRARFNVDALASMSRAEKDLAIARLQMPVEDVRHMPPSANHTLTDAQTQLVVDLLRQ